MTAKNGDSWVETLGEDPSAADGLEASTRFEKAGRTPADGRFRIENDQICFSYGDLREWSCKLVFQCRDRSDETLHAFVDPATGAVTSTFIAEAGERTGDVAATRVDQPAAAAQPASGPVTVTTLRTALVQGLRIEARLALSRSADAIDVVVEALDAEWVAGANFNPVDDPDGWLLEAVNLVAYKGACPACEAKATELSFLLRPIREGRASLDAPIEFEIPVAALESADRLVFYVTALGQTGQAIAFPFEDKALHGLALAVAEGRATEMPASDPPPGVEGADPGAAGGDSLERGAAPGIHQLGPSVWLESDDGCGFLVPPALVEMMGQRRKWEGACLAGPDGRRRADGSGKLFLFDDRGLYTTWLQFGHGAGIEVVEGEVVDRILETPIRFEDDRVECAPERGWGPTTANIEAGDLDIANIYVFSRLAEAAARVAFDTCITAGDTVLERNIDVRISSSKEGLDRINSTTLAGMRYRPKDGARTFSDYARDGVGGNNVKVRRGLPLKYQNAITVYRNIQAENLALIDDADAPIPQIADFLDIGGAGAAQALAAPRRVAITMGDTGFFEGKVAVSWRRTLTPLNGVGPDDVSFTAGTREDRANVPREVIRRIFSEQPFQEKPGYRLTCLFEPGDVPAVAAGAQTGVWATLRQFSGSAVVLDCAQQRPAAQASLSPPTVAPSADEASRDAATADPGIQRPEPQVALRVGDAFRGIALAADGSATFRDAPLFPKTKYDVAGITLELFWGADETAVLVVQREWDSGGLRAAVLDLETGRVIAPALIGEDQVVGEARAEDVVFLASRSAWSQDGRFIAIVMSRGEISHNLAVIDLETERLARPIPDEVSAWSSHLPRIDTIDWSQSTEGAISVVFEEGFCETCRVERVTLSIADGVDLYEISGAAGGPDGAAAQSVVAAVPGAPELIKAICKGGADACTTRIQQAFFDVLGRTVDGAIAATDPLARLAVQAGEAGSLAERIAVLKAFADDPAASRHLSQRIGLETADRIGADVVAGVARSLITGAVVEGLARHYEAADKDDLAEKVRLAGAPAIEIAMLVASPPATLLGIGVYTTQVWAENAVAFVALGAALAEAEQDGSDTRSTLGQIDEMNRSIVESLQKGSVAGPAFAEKAALGNPLSARMRETFEDVLRENMIIQADLLKSHDVLEEGWRSYITDAAQLLTEAVQ